MAGTLPDKEDVAVVGGGFCGLSAARVLAQRGVRVALFEAESLGWGASCRNGGMVLTGMKLPVPTLIKAAMAANWCSACTPPRSSPLTLSSGSSTKRESTATSLAAGHLEVACKQAHFDDLRCRGRRAHQERVQS